MFGDIKEMDLEEMKHEINELETSYVECFKDGVDSYTLLQLWSRIKELRDHLNY